MCPLPFGKRIYKPLTKILPLCNTYLESFNLGNKRQYVNIKRKDWIRNYLTLFFKQNNQHYNRSATFIAVLRNIWQIRNETAFNNVKLICMGFGVQNLMEAKK